MMLKSKRGSELVEASVAIPVFLLLVFSLISLMILCYNSLRTQTEMHNLLVTESNRNNSVFDIKIKKEETSKNLGGLSGMIVTRTAEGRIYVMNQGETIRLGQMLELENE